MKAFAQQLSGIIRVGPDTVDWGSPWDYAVTYSASDTEVCTLLALKGDGKFTSAHRRAIIACVRGLGFKKIRWDRIKGALTRHIES